VEFVRVAARAGEIALLIGCGGQVGEVRCGQDEMAMLGREIVSECKKVGGALDSVGQVLGASISKEITKSKQQLKGALDLTSQSHDNHLRALTLALTSAYYVHTAEDHAREILNACEQLAVGLGACKKSERSDKRRKHGMDSDHDTEPEVTGNSPLRPWVGERLHEMEKRAGNEQAAKRRSSTNRQLAVAMENVAKRGSQYQRTH